MKRQALIHNLQREVGAFPSTSKIDKYLGKRKGTAAKILADVPPFIDGRSKRYFVEDVADAIIERWPEEE